MIHQSRRRSGWPRGRPALRAGPAEGVAGHRTRRSVPCRLDPPGTGTVCRAGSTRPGPEPSREQDLAAEQDRFTLQVGWPKAQPDTARAHLGRIALRQSDLPGAWIRSVRCSWPRSGSP